MNSINKTKNSNKTQVYVWDKFIRLFHWSLVICVVLAILFQELREVHKFIGYTMATLVAMRIIWGLMGSHYARFSSFIPSPKTLINYIKSLKNGNEKHYLGHNPLGSIMVVALISTLIGLFITGYMMGMDEYWGEEWLEELHQFFYLGILFLVPLHLLGVIFGSVREKQNLIKSMINGFKSK